MCLSKLCVNGQVGRIYVDCREDCMIDQWFSC